MDNSGGDPLSNQVFQAGMLTFAAAIAKLVQDSSDAIVRNAAASTAAITKSVQDSSTKIENSLQASSTAIAIDKGAASISAMLAPLRTLQQARAALEPEKTVELAAIHETLKRPRA